MSRKRRSRRSKWTSRTVRRRWILWSLCSGVWSTWSWRPPPSSPPSPTGIYLWKWPLIQRYTQFSKSGKRKRNSSKINCQDITIMSSKHHVQFKPSSYEPVMHSYFTVDFKNLLGTQRIFHENWLIWLCVKGGKSHEDCFSRRKTLVPNLFCAECIMILDLFDYNSCWYPFSCSCKSWGQWHLRISFRNYSFANGGFSDLKNFNVPI